MTKGKTGVRGRDSVKQRTIVGNRATTDATVSSARSENPPADVTHPFRTCCVSGAAGGPTNREGPSFPRAPTFVRRGGAGGGSGRLRRRPRRRRTRERAGGREAGGRAGGGGRWAGPQRKGEGGGGGGGGEGGGGRAPRGERKGGRG